MQQSLEKNRSMWFFRADSGFFSGELLDLLEYFKWDYLIKVKLKNLVNLLEKQNWILIDKNNNVAICEFEYKAASWKKPRMLKAIRTVKEYVEKDFLGVKQIIPVYQYACYVSSYVELDAAELHKDYKQRSTSETWIEQVKGQAMAGATLTNDFWANDIMWQLIINYTTLNGIKHDVMSSWEKIIREYYMNDSFGKYISKVERKAAKLIDKDRIVGLNEREEVENILKYVKDNYQWNGIHGEMAQSSLTVFLKEKSGNIGNLNLFTIGLLNAVGIEAKGVIMSTRNHGRIYYQYPFTHYFNYVLIYANIDGEHVLLDATNPYLSIWSIPDICINGKGLLIDKKEVEWIPLEDKISSENVWKFFITMDEKEMSVKVQMRSTGYLGAKLREKINDESFSLYNGLIKSDGIVDESLHVKNKLNAEEPLDVEFDYIGESVNGVDKFYFNPFISIVRNDNPLKEKSRSYPIDFTYPKKYVFESTINIPNGYKFDYYLDDYKKVSNDYIDINYITHLSEGTLSIRFDYHFKKSKYPTSSYNELRSFYDEIVKLGQEKVVLSKTKK
jgi:hypothetical protein